MTRFPHRPEKKSENQLPHICSAESRRSNYKPGAGLLALGGECPKGHLWLATGTAHLQGLRDCNVPQVRRLSAAARACVQEETWPHRPRVRDWTDTSPTTQQLSSFFLGTSCPQRHAGDNAAESCKAETNLYFNNFIDSSCE